MLNKPSISMKILKFCSCFGVELYIYFENHGVAEMIQIKKSLTIQKISTIIYNDHGFNKVFSGEKRYILEFSVSIASSNLLCIKEELKRVGKWSSIHFDIEDGNFTPNITFGLSLLKKMTEIVEPKKIMVHLMVTNPLYYLNELSLIGVGSVFAHIEALAFPMAFLNRARSLNLKAGLAFNISTPLTYVKPFVPLLDAVLIMTSEHDEAGENLWLPALDKVKEAVDLLQIPVWADGGLNDAAINNLYHVNAYGGVLGRHVFSSADPMGVLENLALRFGDFAE